MEKCKGLKNATDDTTAYESDGAPLTSLYSTGNRDSQDSHAVFTLRNLEAAPPSGSSSSSLAGNVKEKDTAQQLSSKVKIHPEDSPDILARAIAHGDDIHELSGRLEDTKSSVATSEEFMEKEKLSIGEGRSNSESIEIVSECLGIRRRKISRLDSQKANGQEGGEKRPEDDKTLGPLSSRGKDSPILNGSDVKQKAADKKGAKQVKGKCSGVEKESGAQSGAKVAGKKSTDSASLDGLRDIDSDRKVHESLETFIRQTMGREPYMSFTSRPGEKPLQRIIEHQQAANNFVKSLKVDVDIRDGQEDNSNVEPHPADVEKDPSGTKGVCGIARGFQPDRNLHTIKNSVPQAVAAFATAAAKTPGKQNPGLDHLTDLPGWPLLSPTKVQLQKCEKCSREFFSPFNHRRHSRTHRRISHVDKEDLCLKRKTIAAYWNKLNMEEVQQVFASARKYDLEDLSGESVLRGIIDIMNQNSLMTLPPAYVKAGQELLVMLDNKQKVSPLVSDQLFSVLDEASEKTFLFSQGDASKNGLEERNLVASLGFIVEQTLVKAWMADKDAEALRNQQELVKEEEAAQMKRERNVAKKKKKKEKSRQKGLKERKLGVSQLAMNEENETVDDENPSPEIIEEDNSPTASSASVNSSGLENPLLEPLEMELNNQVQQSEARVQSVGGEDGYLLKSKENFSVLVTSREVVADSVDGDKGQHSDGLLVSNGEEGEIYSKFPPSYQVKMEDQGGSRIIDQDQNIAEARKRTPLRSYREPSRVDYQDCYSYQRGGWVPEPRYQEVAQQSSYRTPRKPLVGLPFASNNEHGSSPVPGFYRGKPANLRGTTPFPATQQWAKKTQTPVAVDHVKDGQEDESSQDTDHITNKSSVENLVSAHETDADTVGNSGIEKEEFRTVDKKETLTAPVTSVANVVAGTAGLSSGSTASFNLNVNSDDWPPLSDSRATYFPRSGGLYSLAPYQCEIDSKAMNKVNNDKSGCHQVGLNSKVEGSNPTPFPPVRGLVDEISTEAVNVDLQRGIMIGSVSVPLGDHVHPFRAGLGTAGSRMNTFPVLQSYTAVLAAPPVRYTRDPIADTANRQRVHEATGLAEFGVSTNVQTGDTFPGPGHFRASSLRSAPPFSFNPRHVRGPTYPAGDRGERGILTKQPSWSGGLVRHLPQKVWRPVRSTAENADPNSIAGPGSESSQTNAEEKVSTDAVDNKRNVTTLSQAEGNQGQDIEPRNVEEIPTATNDKSAQANTGNDVLIVQEEKEDVPQNFTTRDSVDADRELVHYLQEKSEAELVAKVSASENVSQCVKSNSSEQYMKFTQDKSADTERMDDKALVKTALSHSAWIAEAVEFHLSRWNLSRKDPETVVPKCDEEHPELLTTKWIEFMDSLPAVLARTTLCKEDYQSRAHNSRHTGAKSVSTIMDEQRASTPESAQASSGCPRAVSTDEVRDISPCESGSSCGVCSRGVDSVSGPQSQERGDTEGRIGSRCGSSCSDSNISISRTDGRRWTGIVSTTRERLPEQRYMTRQGCPEEKISC